jgi:hypothetical protein
LDEHINVQDDNVPDWAFEQTPAEDSEPPDFEDHDPPDSVFDGSESDGLEPHDCEDHRAVRTCPELVRTVPPTHDRKRHGTTEESSPTKAPLGKPTPGTSNLTKMPTATPVTRPTTNGRIGFYVENGRIYLDRGKSKKLIAAFKATIVKEVCIDDGGQVSREFEIEGTTCDGQILERICVLAKDLADKSAAWVDARWGSRAKLAPRYAGYLRHALKDISSPEVRRVYSHTGWRRIGDDWVYLSAASKQAQTRLDGTLAYYSVPSSVDIATVRSAVALSLSIRGVVGDRTALPLICAIYRAPLCEFLPFDCVLWFVGRSQSHKTSLVVLALQHFGSEFSASNLPATWLDTSATLETRAFLAKDVILMIDDFAPSSPDNKDPMRVAAMTFIRSVGNGTARGRMTSSLDQRPVHPPRGLAISTAEHMPSSAESVVGRTFPISQRRGDVNIDELSRMQRRAGELPNAISGYVDFIGRRAADPGFRGSLRRRHAELRQELASASRHPRAPHEAANLALGGELFAEFALEIGVFDDASASAFLKDVRAALVEQLTEFAALSEDPVARACDVIHGILARGTTAPRSIPSVDETGHGNDIDGRSIGWRVGGKIYLFPRTAYATVRDEIEAAGGQMPYSEADLWRELVNRKIARRGPVDHPTTIQMRTPGGARQWVVEIDAAILAKVVGITPALKAIKGGSSPKPAATVIAAKKRK